MSSNNKDFVWTDELVYKLLVRAACNEKDFSLKGIKFIEEFKKKKEEQEAVSMPFICESEIESDGSYARFTIQGFVSKEKYEEITKSINKVLNPNTDTPIEEKSLEVLEMNMIMEMERMLKERIDLSTSELVRYHFLKITQKVFKDFKYKIPFKWHELNSPKSATEKDTQVEKEWEILNYDFVKFPLESGVDPKDPRIPHTIKIISTGRQYSRGQKLKRWGKILNFEFRYDRVLAKCDDYVGLVDYSQWNDDNSPEPTNVKPKEDKPVLFTTEDGVGIYEGDKYWAVSPINFLLAPPET